MKLHVLGSSSRGNCYLLQSEQTGEVLILEAGVKFDKVKLALDFNLSSVVGCCITHEHGDHSKHVRKFIEARIPLAMSTGTAQSLDICGCTMVQTLKPQEPVSFGAFKVMPFSVQHDASEPFGYLIRHPECGMVLFATDTYYLKYKFDGLTNILLECNYRLDILDRNIANGIVSPVVRRRIIKSHMSFDTCQETLLANDLSKVNNIVLIHLSADNSHADEFVNGIKATTGKAVIVAHKDLILDFNKTPF